MLLSVSLNLLAICRLVNAHSLTITLGNRPEFESKGMYPVLRVQARKNEEAVILFSNTIARRVS